MVTEIAHSASVIPTIRFTNAETKTAPRGAVLNRESRDYLSVQTSWPGYEVRITQSAGNFDSGRLANAHEVPVSNHCINSAPVSRVVALITAFRTSAIAAWACATVALFDSW